MRYRREDISVQQRHPRSNAGDTIPTICALVTEQPWSFLEDVGSLGTPFLSFQERGVVVGFSTRTEERDRVLAPE